MPAAAVYLSAQLLVIPIGTYNKFCVVLLLFYQSVVSFASCETYNCTLTSQDLSNEQVQLAFLRRKTL